MSKKTELITIKALVKKILEQDQRARNSDSFLYFKVLNVVSFEKRMDLNKIPVTVFLLKMNEWGFPPFESVRRSRQKLQATYPELAGSDEVEEFRAVEEQKYRAYARGEWYDR